MQLAAGGILSTGQGNAGNPAFGTIHGRNFVTALAGTPSRVGHSLCIQDSVSRINPSITTIPLEGKFEGKRFHWL